MGQWGEKKSNSLKMQCDADAGVCDRTASGVTRKFCFPSLQKKQNAEEYAWKCTLLY